MGVERVERFGEHITADNGVLRRAMVERVGMLGVRSAGNLASGPPIDDPLSTGDRYPLRLYDASSYASWFGVAVFLVSFGVLIDNTSGFGEPKVATAMLILGFAFTVWATAVYFKANWPIHRSPAFIALLVLVILFMLITVWLAVRVWIKF
jgi:hypothetical protein